jgi:hypothetical protein
MLRIQKLEDAESAVLALSGRIEGEDFAHLKLMPEVEERDTVFDLKEVNLVSPEAIRFFALCERKGTPLKNCPAYIREWIAWGRDPEGALDL